MLRVIAFPLLFLLSACAGSDPTVAPVLLSDGMYSESGSLVVNLGGRDAAQANADDTCGHHASVVKFERAFPYWRAIFRC